MGSTTPVTAPMVGKILIVSVKPGDTVDEDETVIIMEAMKMEIPVVAPTKGVIKEIKVVPGQMVNSDDILAIME